MMMIPRHTAGDFFMLDKSPHLCYNIPNHNHGDKDHEILP